VTTNVVVFVGSSATIGRAGATRGRGLGAALRVAAAASISL
jgi:hypothetical protein